MVLLKGTQHFQGRHSSRLLGPSGERWPQRSWLGHVPTSGLQYPSPSSLGLPGPQGEAWELQAYGGPHPHLPAALSATQPCLLARCLERGALPQQLELVVSRCRRPLSPSVAHRGVRSDSLLQTTSTDTGLLAALTTGSLEYRARDRGFVLTGSPFLPVLLS